MAGSKHPSAKSLANLEKGKNYFAKIPKEKLRELTSKGGKIARANDKERERMADTAKRVLQELCEGKDGVMITTQEAGLAMCVYMFIKTGDPKYGEFLAKLTGDLNQVQKHEILNISTDIDVKKVKALRDLLAKDIKKK